MFKTLILMMSFSLLTACAQPQSDKGKDYLATEDNREAMLIDSGNSAQLIALYQNQLKRSENAGTRIKLANVYLREGDAESALFVVSDVENVNTHADALKVQAKSHYMLGDYDNALQAADRAIALTEKDGELYNLLGVIHSERGDFSAAENALNQARRFFYDDDKVKNNLASVYILQGNYDKAVTLLGVLYAASPSDPTTYANLIIALIKAGEREQGLALIKQHYDFDYPEQIVNAIESSKPADAGRISIEQLNDNQLP